MVFSSPYFLFLFLPAALLVCLSLARRAFVWPVALVSVLFYAWSGGLDTLVLLGIVVGNYLAARWIGRHSSRAGLTILVMGNVLVLFWFKYAKFVAENFDALVGTHLALRLPSVVLPAGVSFFVFQAISYLVDVRRGDIQAEPRLGVYAAYQTFFPHLIAGPIVRFRDVIDDFHTPRIEPKFFASGVRRFAHGLFKKVVIADGVAPIANAVFGLGSDDLDAAASWLGCVAYSLQIYFDFSGYSDMAVGLARMFGIRFHENFERPYVSRSVTEFWRRWHISLSSWFRDYVYIPLGGNRGGDLATYRNLLIVFLVTGLWHGANWTFVLWGLFHGAFLVLERVSLGDRLRALRHPAFRFFYCLPVVLCGWVLFRANNVSQALDLWSAMVDPLAGFRPGLASRAALTPYSVGALGVGVCIFALPGTVAFGPSLMEPNTSRGEWAALAYTIVALCVCSVLILTGSYSPFLYFNF